MGTVKKYLAKMLNEMSTLNCTYIFKSRFYANFRNLGAGVFIYLFSNYSVTLLCEALQHMRFSQIQTCILSFFNY